MLFHDEDEVVERHEILAHADRPGLPPGLEGPDQFASSDHGRVEPVDDLGRNRRELAVNGRFPAKKLGGAEMSLDELVEHPVVDLAALDLSSERPDFGFGLPA